MSFHNYNKPAVISIVLIVMLSANTSHAAAPRAGVYENIQSFPENGDVVGIAVDFKPGPLPVIVVTTCEGQCYGGKPWPMTVKGSTIAFTVCDGGAVDQDHRPVPCTPLHYRGAFRSGNALELAIDGYPGSKTVLKRKPHPQPHEVEQMACQADHC
ncbi:hypothetical protein [Asticcacaulis taihuensis]|uniref:hypothetical protein n=1 Tax=Asticcacaulis taihuensis TaxID=260084 RepID=UPI0026ED07F1|nr:hypothetical protein [Asticcacaulis taihuensis]